jgi:thymidylate synthase
MDSAAKKSFVIGIRTMRPYLDIVRDILNHGAWKNNRTGVRAKTIAGAMFAHDMSKGFPLLTTKSVPLRLVATELEFFLQGITDKRWLQERRNHIWDEWANPEKASYGHSPEAKRRMFEERDLGPVYGFQWRHFGAEYTSHDADYTEKGIDQLRNVVEKLKVDPNDRRMIVSAWNPLALEKMALPPCHYSFQVTVIDGKLNLLWNQRSVDTMLGLPFNIASYGLLLHLLAREANLQEGRLVGFLADVHIYESHVAGAREQIERDADHYPLPSITTDPFTSIFSWESKDSQATSYKHYPKIQFEIAV